MVKKEMIENMKNCIRTLDHEQLAKLLNIHSLYITNDSISVPYKAGKTLEEWVLLRLEKTTNEEDYTSVIELISMIHTVGAV